MTKNVNLPYNEYIEAYICQAHIQVKTTGL